MIKLKNLLTEDVNYILKKSPNAIISKAADLMAGVFRIKFKATRDETTPPDFAHDIMYVLTSPKNTQYGPASSFANGDWYYIIGDDRKAGSERRLVTDVLIYPKRKLVGVESGKQRWEEIQSLFKTTPKSSGKVGSSDIIKVSDFVSAIDPKVDRIPETLGTGATLIKQINDILNNTVTDAPDGNEKVVVVKKDGSSDDSKKDDSVVIDKKDGEIKKDDEDKKDELDDSTTAYALQPYKRKKDPAYPNGVNAPEITPTKSYFIKNLDLINSAKPDAMIAEDFQQLIVQKVIPVQKFKEISPAVVAFSKLKNPVDGIWGTKSKDVIYELNQAYGIGDTDQVTKQLLDKLFAPLKTESRFSLKSLLQEIKLQEQDLSGLDAAKIKPRTPGNVIAPIKKEVPKTTTPAVKSTTPADKTTPKPTVTPKNEPTKTTDTSKPKSNLQYDYAKEKGQRRGIDKIAAATGASDKLKFDAKLKVWYLDLNVRIVQGPNKADSYGTLHLRDDGTIQVLQNGSGKQLVLGMGSGWSDGGKKLVTKTGTFISSLPAGDAIYETLFKAIRSTAGSWAPYILNIQLNPSESELFWRGLPDQPSLKTKLPADKTKSTSDALFKNAKDTKLENKPAPKRFIQEVAKTFNVTASYDSKLKVWWFDAYLLLNRSPEPAVDQYAFLHVRDDGTIMLKSKGVKLVQGTGSGWSDGGKRMQVKTFGKTVKEETYVSKGAPGPAFVSTLILAIQRISPFWSATKSISSNNSYKFKV